MTVAASKEMNAYFNQLLDEANRCYEVAREARAKGLDPELDVEIPQANDLASRVEMLLKFDGIADVIREASKKHPNREVMSIVVAKKVAKEYKGPKNEALDKAVRVGLAVLTEGILVAPLDGIAEVKIHGEGNSSYASISFAGPIRSAGGTGQAMSVLIADVVRSELDIGPYEATPQEIERWKEEIPLYRRQANLQYVPSEEEIEAIISGCKVCVDGEGTEDAEISGYRDLPRMETNRVRGGACLVVAEGLALKAKKLNKHVKKLGIQNWGFLKVMVKEKKDEGQIKGIQPNEKFIKDMVAGRPVYSHPSTKGGFRLRYGRSRTAGLASISIHPAIMYIVQETLAIGTQIKIERPGKAGISTPCDMLDGPLLLMTNGNLMRVNTAEEAQKIKRSQIEKIVELGEILIPVGEFIENNHPLVPAVFDTGWFTAILDSKDIRVDDVEQMELEESMKLVKKHDIPLHPRHTFMWNNLSIDEVNEFRDLLAKKGKLKDAIVHLPDIEEARKSLIDLRIPYIIENNELILVNAAALYPSLGLKPDGTISKPPEGSFESTVDYVSKLSGFKLMDRCGTYIGARMARPEKAAVRKMKPPVHGLFPVGDAGGAQRLLSKAAEGTGKYKINLEMRKCKDCGETGFLPICEECGAHTWTLNRVEEQTVDAYRILKTSKDKLKLRNMPKVKGVKGMISKNKTPEMPEKSILRAKHEVFVFKDGTSRFDCTDAPLTHFKPKEIGTSVEKLMELGYTTDIEGNPLENDSQMIEMRSQDIVLADNGGDYLLQVSQFIDELLESFYGMGPFYNAKNRHDLVGAGLLGLSPHTSGGVLCRLIGFTRAKVGYAHPFFHAAKRRNCFAPDTRIWVRSDTGWKLVQIEDLVDNRLNLSNTKKDDFGTEYKDEKGLFVPSISRDGKESIKEIIAVSKHPAPIHMIELRTRAGRKIVVTPEHKMLKMGLNLEFQPAHSLKTGDMLPSPKKLETKILETPGLMKDGGNIWLDEIVEKKIIKSSDKHVYSLTVEENHSLVANDLYTGQCDGDEDCFMLLMDGLLNFSVSYLPEKRGGRMDAPLVLMTKIDPNEIDKEAHAVDVGFNYKLEVYEAGLEYTDPKDLESKNLIDTVGNRIGSILQYENFGFTHDTEDISAGPVVSSYKTLESMGEKTNVQLDLARLISAVDEKDVAERLLNNHLIPDMIGNLRTFSNQKVRCTKCGKKYRRMPLAGACRCGHKLIMTVHAASVKKYLEMSKTIAKDFQVSPYICQRIDMLEEGMCSMFENDKVKDCKLSDFF